MSVGFILASIGIYFLLLVVISIFTGRKADQETFFTGNHQSPWYVVAFGMVGASISGVTFISIPGVVGNCADSNANQQFSYMQVVFGYLLGYWVIAAVLMPIYYRMRLTSIYTYLEQRFGTASYKTGAFFFIVSRTIGAAFRVFMVVAVLQNFVFDSLGIPLPVTTLAILLLSWAYTFKGGIKTIVWTDTLQTAVLLFAVASTIFFITKEMGWSFTETVNILSNSEYSQLFFWDINLKSYFWKQFISGAFIAIVMTGLDQDLMQKNNSCRTLADGQKNIFVSCIVLVVVNVLFLGLGALLYIYSETQGIASPAKSDYLFPTLALQHFPAFAGIVFIVGLASTAFSSADSALTALTTSICVDFLGFEKNKSAARRHNRVRYAVHFSLTLFLVAVIFIFYYLLEADVIGNLFTAAGYTYGPLLGLFGLGILTRRKINDRLVPFICIIPPVLCYFLNLYSASLLNGYQIGFEMILINGLLSFAGLWMISKSPK